MTQPTDQRIESSNHDGAVRADTHPAFQWRVVAMLVLLGAVLYAPGLRWGLPATESWSQDTIAGVRTLGAAETWPGAWAGRYPPLHYLVLRACYEPYLRWLVASDEARVDPASGRVRFKPPHAEKIGSLFFIARVVSALMAVGAGLGLYLAASRWPGVGHLAAGIAGGTMMASPAFAYFARLGNVDIPSICWFSWSVVFYVRLLRSRRWYDAALLGLFGSLAISTKDSIAGVYPGMAIVLLGFEAARTRGARSWLAATAGALCRWRWLIGVAAFALPYLWLSGVFHNPGAYVERMKYWLGITPGTIHMRQYRYANQLALLGATLYYAAGAVGWPMLLAMVAAVVHGLRRHRRLALVLLTPVIAYYLMIIVPQGFVYSRFLFPPLALVGVLVGVACVDLWRCSCGVVSIRLGVIGAVALLTLGYTAALNAEMMTDSRYRAERWFEQHVSTSMPIGAFSKPQYLPRMNELGYRTYRVQMSREAFEQPQPDYLILTNYNYEDFADDQQACMRDLLAGQFGYEVTATFGGRYLGTGKSLLGLAGWWTPVPGKISPNITMLTKGGP